MKSPLTAQQICKLAWPNGCTWSDSRVVKVGKIDRNCAFEIQFHPSLEGSEAQYGVSIATYNPENGTVKGKYMKGFPSQSYAFDYVDRLKKSSVVPTV